MACDWRGVYPAVTTQFTEDFRVDIGATLKHIDAMLAAGIHGIVMLGTVGENCSLEHHEKVELLNAVCSHIDGKVPVITGVAEYTTQLACRFSAAAATAGVDGLMVLPALVYKSDPRETIAHYRTIARSVSLPIMCYNNPVSYSVDITPEMFVELASEQNLVAIKESSENVRRITDIRNLLGNRYRLFAGVDDLFLECMVLGAEGWISGLVNAFPNENRALWDLVMGGNWADALALYRWYTPLLHLDTHVKLVQYIKLAMAECGLGSETVRPPRLPLIGAERDEILGIIRAAISTRPALKA